MAQNMKLVGVMETAAPGKKKAAVSKSFNQAEVVKKAASIINGVISSKAKKFLGKPSLKIIEQSNNQIICDIIFPVNYKTNMDGGGIAITDLEDIVESFLPLCNFEDGDEMFTVDGRDWLVGDGDDGAAVRLSAAGIHVWVRAL